MITAVRNVSSNDPTVEVWKYLRLFLNPARTVKRIREIHSIPVGSRQDQNLIKQAKQIGYCLRQAEQYFRAANDVGLATKPLLLYYGAVALSRALVLMNKDGTHSLDAMRRLNKHRHHGLILDQNAAEKSGKAQSAQEFFTDVRCTCFFKENGVPWGHFPLFYESLSPSAIVVRTDIRESDKTAYLERDLTMNTADSLPVLQLENHTLQGLQLLQFLPDLYRDMHELEIGTRLARGNMNRVVTWFYKAVPSDNSSAVTSVATPPEINREIVRVVDEHDYFIDGIGALDKATYWNFIKEKNPNIQKVGEFPTNLHLKLRGESADPNNNPIGYCPDIVDDINGKKFYILEPTNYIPEPASMLALLFCFGMLSRYYPDIWMGILEKNVDVVEITNGLLAVITRKFPNLVLDQMSGIKHFIHL